MNFDINQLLAQYGYFGFFLFGLLNFVIPSEPVLTLAGFQIQEGKLNLFLVMISALLGSFLKTTLIFGSGFLLGEKFLIKYSRWTGFKSENLDFIKNKIQQYGYRVITPMQLIPYIRRFVGAPCGLLRLNYWRFIYYNMLGVMIWFLFLISLGYYYGKSYKTASPTVRLVMHNIGYIIMGIFAFVIIYEVYKFFAEKKKEVTQSN
jgi:membrane protein DedA with SNARE-associated domain